MQGHFILTTGISHCIDLQRVIYYIGGHIGCFLGISKWTDDAGRRRATGAEAVEMIRRAKEEDWEGLREDGFSTLLFN